MVFAENVLSMQTLSLVTGTAPPLQFEAVAQELSPAVPVHCFVPVAQLPTAAALQKAIHDSKTSILPSVFMWISPKHQLRTLKIAKTWPVWPVGRDGMRSGTLCLAPEFLSSLN